jgi:alpha-beta hydrolase superfamily lysophospholipase
MKRPATDMRPESQFRRREIANNEVRLGYLENDGDGPVVVALHGLAGAGDEFIAAAVAVGRSHRFALPDLRGHGHSTRRPADLSRDAPPFDADVMQAVMEGVSAPALSKADAAKPPRGAGSTGPSANVNVYYIVNASHI